MGLIYRLEATADKSGLRFRLVITAAFALPREGLEPVVRLGIFWSLRPLVRAI
jgi:hypothetical protein